MRPRSQTDFSGVGVRPRRHPAVTNGVRTEQQRKFPLFSLILLLIVPLFALSSGLEAAAGAGRRGQHVPGGSAPLVEPRVHLHRPFLVLSQGLLFLLEHEGKAALNLNTPKDLRAQQQQDPHPRLSCATWHGDITGPAPVPGHAAVPEGPWGRQGLTEPGPPAQGSAGARAATHRVQPCCGSRRSAGGWHLTPAP